MNCVRFVSAFGGVHDSLRLFASSRKGSENGLKAVKTLINTVFKVVGPEGLEPPTNPL